MHIFATFDHSTVSPQVNPPNCVIVKVTGEAVVASEVVLPRRDGTRSSVNDYAEAIRAHYEVANKAEKGRLLDKFTTMTDYHRKSAIPVLSGSSRERTAAVGRPKKYDMETIAALRVVWEAAGRICGQQPDTDTSTGKPHAHSAYRTGTLLRVANSG